MFTPPAACHLIDKWILLLLMNSLGRKGACLNKELKSSLPPVIHLSASVGRQSFGLGAVALNLAEVQLRQGWDTRIWCLDTVDEVVNQPECQGFPLERILQFPTRGPRFLRLSWSLQRAAAKGCIPKSAILHQHSIWTATSVATRLWSKHRCGPTIVAPHGCLDAWAVQKSGWKKTLALLAYEGKNLRNASCLHALSMAEAEAIRRFGLRNPIAIVPNGISTTWISSSGDPDNFRLRHQIPPGRRILLFLSRITPKKGLPMFVECLRNAGKEFADWIFVVAGPDEFCHKGKVAALVNRYGLASSVRFVGPLFGIEKRDAFAAADAFVLPSHSEGWPIAVLEAMGAGVPVLTTVATPLTEIVEAAAGWRVEASVEPLTAALLELLGSSKAVLTVMGARGQQLVADRLSWDAIAAQLGLVYQWLMGRRIRPSFVLPAV